MLQSSPFIEITIAEETIYFMKLNLVVAVAQMSATNSHDKSLIFNEALRR